MTILERKICKSILIKDSTNNKILSTYSLFNFLPLCFRKLYQPF
jgi:hypothetical protein